MNTIAIFSNYQNTILEQLRLDKLAKARAARSSAPAITKVDIAPRPPSEAKSGAEDQGDIPEVNNISILPFRFN